MFKHFHMGGTDGQEELQLLGRVTKLKGKLDLR